MSGGIGRRPVQRRKQWQIRMRDEEVALVTEAARIAGEYPTTWARETLKREAARLIELSELICKRGA